MKRLLLLAAILFAASCLHAQTFTIAQTCSNNSTTGTTSQTCTFGSPLTVGNLYIMQAQCDTNAGVNIPSGFTVSDGGTSNTFTQRYLQTALPSQAMAWEVWTAPVTQANTVVTATPTFTLGTTCSSGMTTIGTEIHATTGTIAVDQVATVKSFTTGSSPWTSNSVTTTQANEILIGVFYDDNGGGAAPTVGTCAGTTCTNFLSKKDQFYYQTRETQTVSATGTYTAGIVDATGGVTQLFAGFIAIDSPSGGGGVKRLRGSVVAQ